MALRILQDTYTQEGVQSQQYNHFRIVECSDLDKFQRWCKKAVSAAAASMTHESALHQVIQVDNAHTHKAQALESLQLHSSSVAAKPKRSRLESDASQSSGFPSISLTQLAQQFRGLDLRFSQHDRHITQLDAQVILLCCSCRLSVSIIMPCTLPAICPPAVTAA